MYLQSMGVYSFRLIAYIQEMNKHQPLGARTRNLSALIRDEIDEMIATGQLKPGDRLNEVSLANTFGTSRGPLREALKSLEREGLIDSVVNKGMFVRTLSSHDADNLWRVRLALLPEIAMQIAARVTGSFVDDLGRLIEQMARSVKSGNVAKYHSQNLAFHRTLVEQTGNPRLAEIYMSLFRETYILRSINFLSAGSLERSHSGHQKILTAIGTKKAKKIEEALIGHVSRSRDHVIELIRAEEEQASEK